MSVAANAITTPPKTDNRRLRRHRGPSSPSRRLRSSRNALPLHEALAIGLGCTSAGYRLRPQPEWR